MPTGAGWSDLVGRDQGSDPQLPVCAPRCPQPPPASGDPLGDPPALSAEGRRGDLSGRTWAGFQVGDLLGRGGMGEVYLAEQRSLGRLVALKVLAREAGGSPERRARFAAEVRAAARLSSPQVVAMHDSGEAEGRLWLAMEYVPGRSLAEELHVRRQEGRRFAPREALEIVLQAAQGLVVAHRDRLVHRDIKPGNLLLTAEGGVKIADFGLVRFLDQPGLTLSGMTLGTPQYLSPEQGRGSAVDARSDIYSLGVVLYELLTLRPPFDGDSAETLIFQHNFAEPDLPARLNPDLPQDLQAVCLKCLQKEPERRYGEAAALVADLERVRTGLAPVQAVFVPDGLDTGARRALQQRAGAPRRWRPVLLACALVAVASAWAWREMRRRDPGAAEPGAEAPPALSAPGAAAGAAEAAALRARLAALDAPRGLPEGIGADLDRYEALSGFADPQAARWRRRYAEVRALQARLAPLDQAISPPAGAADDLARLLALVGADDAQVAAWGGKLAALARLRQRLSPLDRPGPLPAEADADLDAWMHLVGAGDADLDRWRTRISEQRALAARLDAWDACLVLPEDAVPRWQADLARQRALAGADARHARAAARLAVLLGPPPPAWAAAHGRDRFGPWCELRVAGAVQRLRWLPPHGFRLGGGDGGVEVRLTRGLWLADGECSQALWSAVMGGNPSHLRDPQLPVDQVDAAEAEAFCRRLRALPVPCPARLPSEAEWEAAMRAGSSRPWGAIADARLAAVVAHRGGGPAGPRPVGAGAANPLGLHDGPGNLREWCADGFAPLPAGPLAEDPLAPPAALRVVRGGSWDDDLDACRLDRRQGVPADAASPLIGFRFAVEP